MLYFFGASHHSTDNDFTFLKSFDSIVNVIPVVAKADSFKADEMHHLKMDIIEKAHARKVRFFDCSQAIEEVAEVSFP
jgi:septin family protein